MGIRQLVPASSRSFWQLYGEVEGLRAEVGELSRLLEAHDSHTKMMLWELMRKDGESISDTKKRFFSSLEPAEGSQRVVQLALTQLLFEFDQLCSENDISYWVACGTALGLVRHQGFVPWDDDVDLGMIRGDIEKLKGLVSESDRFRVTEVFDWNQKSKQVRFRYRDEAIPCFLDLFIFDYTCSSDHSFFDQMQDDRKLLLAHIEESKEIAFWNENNKFIKANTEDGKKIAEFFEKAVHVEYSRDGFLVESSEKAFGVMWGIDNLDSWDKLDWISPIEDVFPLRRESFEGISVNAMANIEGYLSEHYGDIYSLPRDLNTHFDHIKKAKLANEETMKLLGELASLRNED